MHTIKRKQIIITSLICLSPIVLGLILWNRLPETMAIHFNINYEPDGFASKRFVVFIIPLFMAMIQIFCCIVNDITSKKYTHEGKAEIFTKWILPVVSVVLMVATFAFNMGYNIDIHMVVSLLVGFILTLSGYTISKLDYVRTRMCGKPKTIEPEKAKKINKFLGIETVIMGVIFIISAFFPPNVTIISLILLIPYAIISVIYTIKNSR